MQIRDKLTFLFLLIVALIMGASSLAIYYLSAQYRKQEFYERIENKARNVAKLLIEVEEVDAELLRKIEENNPVSLPNEEITIFDYQNQVLYSSEGVQTVEVNEALLNRIRLEGEVRFVFGNQEVLGVLFTDQYDRVVVVASATDIFGYRKLNNLRNVLFIVFGAGLLFTFISGRIFAQRTLSPISRVIAQVDAIGISNLSSRVDEGNQTDELAQLAGTFNDMLDRLEEAFKLQKNFIANASHELRTPLTAITGQLEVTLLSDRTAEDYKRTVNSVLDDIKNLNYLSNRLLLLAQASSESVESSFGSIRVDELLWQSAGELQKRNPSYKVSISFNEDLEDDQMTIVGNEQLIKTALLNLMDNGCKYSDPHEVQVSVEPDSGQLVLTFQDFGIGIDEEEQELIFEPFHRGSNAQNIKGHGIGLSLVQRIVKLHEGTLILISKKGKGSTFTLTLPVEKKN
ncbi:HAMP domain-containing sensor histidine kinase [Imperialibacter roseus]|uniref:histidine kinase n=1 Tax=Imperialibacter roseus TaxID=1324217 RepID=A0ABZ0IWG2_9BACT|nr:HAMP domain-containing sensor histidine kinase [Imperialibacter roseus]WOK08016.1 HAMP domain-containing sensor histidine kinase [Imperialibacter roseus]